MIWNPPAEERADRILAAYIAGEIGTEDDNNPADAAAYRRELAEAITAFIRRQHPSFAGSPPDGTIGRDGGLPQEYLLMLIGHALWSVGEEQAARRLLEIERHTLNLPATFIEAVLAPDISIMHWHILLASRALRASSPGTTLKGTLWVLDLERMVLPAPDSLELTTLNVVRNAVDRLAVLWDTCRGHGLLGLRYANKVAAGILRCPRRSSRSMALAAEILGQVRGRLQALKTERGWEETPRVIMLDL